jgi:hypothetical protein
VKLQRPWGLVVRPRGACGVHEGTGNSSPHCSPQVDTDWQWRYSVQNGIGFIVGAKEGGRWRSAGYEACCWG